MSTMSYTQMVEGSSPNQTHVSTEVASEYKPACDKPVSPEETGEQALRDGLMALMAVHASKDHKLCLDMLEISWESNAAEMISEVAILVEISSDGGLILTSAAIPTGSILTLKAENSSITASVISCEQDEFGYLVLFAADRSVAWFPEGYQPPHLLAA
jgi:hypothetical protein